MSLGAVDDEDASAAKDDKPNLLDDDALKCTICLDVCERPVTVSRLLRQCAHPTCHAAQCMHCWSSAHRDTNMLLHT
jgi:hypothetical protein